MSEKPTPQMFYVQDPFTEEVQGPLSASDLKQRFSGGARRMGRFKVNDWPMDACQSGQGTQATHGSFP